MRGARAVCSARRTQRADAGMRVLMAPVQTAALFEVLLCLPTAPALPIEGTETSVRLRFMGSSRTSYCLSSCLHGVPDVEAQ
jgi:hypothetical protein